MIVELPMEAWQRVVDALPEGWERDRIAGFIRGRQELRTPWLQVTRSQEDGRSATSTAIFNSYEDMLGLYETWQEALREYRGDHPWNPDSFGDDANGIDGLMVWRDA